jgi:hypothetical protein
VDSGRLNYNLVKYCSVPFVVLTDLLNSKKPKKKKGLLATTITQVFVPLPFFCFLSFITGE